jgi:hypothetical protein
VSQRFAMLPGGWKDSSGNRRWSHDLGQGHVCMICRQASCNGRFCEPASTLSEGHQGMLGRYDRHLVAIIGVTLVAIAIIIIAIGWNDLHTLEFYPNERLDL